MAARRVNVTNTGIGNTMTLIGQMAKKLGLALPVPGTPELTKTFVEHGATINDHAKQIDDLWAKVNSIPFD